MTVVAELFATLGLQVDSAMFAKADAAIAAVAEEAQVVVDALKGAGISAETAGADIGTSFRGANKHVTALAETLDVAKAKMLETAEAAHALTAANEEGALASATTGAHAPAAHVTGHAAHNAAPHAAGGHGGHGGHGGNFLVETMMSPLRAAAHGFMAAFAVHEVLHFAESISEAGTAIVKTSEQIGISTDAIQEFQFATKMTNVDFESFRTGMRMMEVDAGKGGKALKGLGVAVKDTNGKTKTADQLFEEVADKVAATEDPLKKAAIAQAAFGRGGVQLLPLLNKGAEGIAELRKEAQELGLEFDHELIESNEEFEDSFKKLTFAMQGLKGFIGKYLLPAVTSVIKKFVTAEVAIRKLATETKYLQTVAFMGLAYAAVKAGNALAAAGRTAVLEWVKGKAVWLLTAAAFIGIALAIEDIYGAINGSESQIGQWLDEWQGAGTIDALVRNLAAGFHMMREELEHLLALDLGKLAVIQALMHPVDAARTIVDANQRMNSKAALRGQREALVEASQSKDPIVAKIAKRNLAKFDREHFGEIEAPRALGQGVGAAAEQQQFGIVGASAASTGTVGAVGGLPPVTVNQEFNGTNLKPEDVKHHVKEGVHEALSVQAKKVREAHAPRTGGQGHH